MSALGNLIPLIILFVVLGGGAFIGYQIYLWSNEMSERGKKHMEKKNMSFTKEGGLKVGVKEVKDEAYTDKTQNVLVNVWNNSGFSAPAQEKKSWTGSGSGSSTPRPSSSRSASSQSRPTDPRTASTTSARGTENLAPPMPRTSSKRSSSPVPGGWS